VRGRNYLKLDRLAAIIGTLGFSVLKVCGKLSVQKLLSVKI
jgi:hypothetical protein